MTFGAATTSHKDNRSKGGSKRILLSMPAELLAAIDHEASSYYMTRSDLMRRALIWYLQPQSRLGSLNPSQGNDSDGLCTNPEELLKILQHQKLLNGVKAIQYNMKKQRKALRSNK